jgi:hypothetical protein
MKTTNTIDWTKPLRTKETPPRAVEIITREGRDKTFPVIGYIGAEKSLHGWTKDGRWSFCGRASTKDLENVPEWKLPEPPEGRSWHHGAKPWTEAMLPEGFRPLMHGEKMEIGDQWLSHIESIWTDCVEGEHGRDITTTHPFRTRRPLPQKVSDEPWADEKVAYAEGKTVQYKSLWTDGWTDLKNGPMWMRTENHPFKPEYRVKPEPIKVPLELEDVPPNSVIRVSSNKNRWYLILSANPFGVVTDIVENLSFRAVMEKQWEIKRPNQDWEPCYKMI